MTDAPVVPVVRPRMVLVVVVETEGGAETVGIIGVEVATLPVVGNMPIVGTAAAELTPRLPISMDPIGIPVRAAPPGVVGDVDVGVEDEAMLEPEPHMPDMPGVPINPDVVDIPDVAEPPEAADIPGVAAVAGAAIPTPIPPPSKLAVDPNIDEGAVPRVAQVVALLCIEIVPVASPGAGLMPGDAISVEPRGMPVGAIVEPVPRPSGEVALMLGVGLAITLICAVAALQRTSGMTAAIIKSLIGILLLKHGRSIMRRCVTHRGPFAETHSRYGVRQGERRQLLNAADSANVSKSN